MINTSLPHKKPSKPPDKKDIERKAAWSKALGALILKGIDMDAAQKRINAEYDFPHDWSPGKPLPKS